MFAPPLVQSWNKVKLVKMVPGLIHHTLATINTEIAGGGGGESGLRADSAGKQEYTDIRQNIEASVRQT